jgi:hypothetical protein
MYRYLYDVRVRRFPATQRQLRGVASPWPTPPSMSFVATIRGAPGPLHCKQYPQSRWVGNDAERDTGSTSNTNLFEHQPSLSMPELATPWAESHACDQRCWYQFTSVSHFSRLTGSHVQPCHLLRPYCFGTITYIWSRFRPIWVQFSHPYLYQNLKIS